MFDQPKSEHRSARERADNPPQLQIINEAGGFRVPSLGKEVRLQHTASPRQVPDVDAAPSRRIHGRDGCATRPICIPTTREVQLSGDSGADDNARPL